MSNAVTLVMYHYVRPIASGPFPALKGLETSAFVGQVDWLQKHYTLVRPADVLDALDHGIRLPERAALLTFDDGYADHLTHVMPVLRARGVSGVFFAPMAAVLERTMLDVNRAHFILAAARDLDDLERRLEAEVEAARGEFALPPLDDYRRTCRVPYSFDGPQVGYIKRLLQHALPEALRMRISAALFAQFVTPDERGFADELYMDAGGLQQLADAGMEVAAHGYRHYWLGRLDAEAQRRDIDQSLAAIASIGLGQRRFWFGYPYGSYDAVTRSILEAHGCAAAVTSAPAVADCETTPRLELPRMDTMSFPCQPDAPLARANGAMHR